MSEHAFVQENLAGYLADGLPAAERERLERHVHGCAECHQLMTEQREFDASLDQLFAGVRPAAGLENRVLAKLRCDPMKRRIAWTKAWRWVGSAAAVLLLGAVGFGMQQLVESGSMPFPGMWGEERAQAQSQNRLKQVGLGFHGMVGGKLDPVAQAQLAREANGKFQTFDGDPVARDFDGEINYSVGGKKDVSVPGSGEKAKTEGRPEEGQRGAEEGKFRFFIGGEGGASAPKAGYSEELPDPAKAKEGFDDGITQERLESLKKLAGEFKTSEATASSKLQSPLAGFRTGQPAPPMSVPADPARGDGVFTTRDKLDEQTKVRHYELATGKETKDVAPSAEGLAKPSDGRSTVGGFAGRGFGGPTGGRMPAGKGGGGGLPGPLVGGGGAAPATQPGLMPPTATATTPAPGLPPTMGPDFGYLVGDLSNKEQSKATSKKAIQESYEYYRVQVAPVAPGSSPTAGLIANVNEKGPGKDTLEALKFPPPADGPPKGNAAKTGPGYFKESPMSSVAGRDGDKGSPKKDDIGKQLAQGQKGDPKGERKSEGEQKPAETAPPKPGSPISAQTPPQPEPKPVVRKIIRTGDVEFEVENFDNAVASVTQLINGIPGAFIATVNSDKLPNGKVKGSVVVRMPPETLDKFLLDIRKELAKFGELKGQRIGSQDVTKLYYDLESRLRAARTMEERLIDIIKKGKGEIKDLLLAEKELGVWRTKIEEMEGEIRFYNNQVGLSTLTITLIEKEIRTAASMVITEHVNMKIEADDVEKSLQSALTAVTEAKGRVTKSDLKQHAAGQYEAILQFEVSPAAAGPVKDKLKTLGVVTHHDSQRLQQAEGGLAKGEIKSRVTDVQFNVTLHNVANVQPRESYILTIAVVDVPADYRKLQDAVNLAKGQARSGNLDEKDKLNVTSQFDFDVPSSARDTIEKLVAGLGDVLAKTTSRAAPGETATDRKVGYRLSLRSLTAVPPREAYHLDIATPDVPADYRTVQTAVGAAKGQLRVISLNEADKLNAIATLEFDVPTAARDTIDKLLAGLGDGMGDTLSRNTVRVQPHETATERKVGYKLTLRNLAKIQARESYQLEIATPDVTAEYYKLQKEVKEAKGYVLGITLNEADKLNTSATLSFDVPADERGKFDLLLSGLGETLSRNTVRVQPAETATERKVGYRLTLYNLAKVQPREAYRIDIASKDVAADYRQLQDAIAAAKGQIKAINLNEQDKLNTNANVDFDVAAGDREKFKKMLTALGEVLSSATLRAAPNEKATDLKSGFRVTLRNIAGVRPRETMVLQIVSLDVPGNYRKLHDAVTKAQGHVRSGQLKEPDKLKVSGEFEFDLPAGEKESIEKLLADAGEIYSRTLSRLAPGELATDKKVGYNVIFTNAAALTPREKVNLEIEVDSVEKTAAKMKSMVRAKGGTVVNEPIKQGASGQVRAVLWFNVPLSAKDELVQNFKDFGKVKESGSSSNPQAPDTKLATLHLDVVLYNRAPIVADDEGVWAPIRTSLSYSFRMLSWSLMFIVFGLSVVLPWALLVWVAVKVIKRFRGKTQPAPAAAT